MAKPIKAAQKPVEVEEDFEDETEEAAEDDDNFE